MADNPIKAVVIDDEEPGIDYLQKLLIEFCPTVEVIGTADSIKSGINLLLRTKPDVVFLDIKMPGGTGFDILEQVKTIDFEVIFTTAHNNYAIKAFRFSALDYLLKPVDPDELMMAVEKISEKKATSLLQGKIDFFINQFSRQQEFDRITMPTAEGFEVIVLEDIIRCEGEGSYTRIYIRDQQPMLVSKVLKDVEALIQGPRFFRIHRSHLINMKEVRAFRRADGGSVVMSDGEEIYISRRKKDEFLRLFQSV